MARFRSETSHCPPDPCKLLRHNQCSRPKERVLTWSGDDATTRFKRNFSPIVPGMAASVLKSELEVAIVSAWQECEPRFDIAADSSAILAVRVDNTLAQSATDLRHRSPPSSHRFCLRARVLSNRVMLRGLPCHRAVVTRGRCDIPRG